MRPASVPSSGREIFFPPGNFTTPPTKMAEHVDVSATSSDNVSLDRPGEKRTTSSARQPMPGLPLPERLIRRRNAVAVVEPATVNVWRAQLAKVSSCEGADYDGGSGLVTDFEFSDARPRSRCVLTCDGNYQKMVMTLATSEQDQDPNPKCLFKIPLPNEDDLLDLRVYESNRSLELRLTPKGEASSKSEPRKIWSLSFRTQKKHLSNAKAMVKRLENVTCDMPEDWFSYRNYSRSAPKLNEGATGSNSPSGWSVPITGGHVWHFTGFLASREFQQALGNIAADPEKESAVPAPKTRSRVKAEKKKKKHEKRRQVRLGQLPADGPVAEDHESSPSPEIVPGVSQERKKSKAAVGLPSSPPSVMSQEYDVEKILDVGVNEETKDTQYLVQWVGFEEPTWERATLIPPPVIENFYRGRFASS